MNLQRARALNQHSYLGGPLIYWMSRDQRAHDNWALQLVAERAEKQHVPFAVVFCLNPQFLGATERQYDFMLTGLSEVETELAALNIPFYLLHGEIVTELPKFIKEHHVGGVVTDFSPLKIGREWRDTLAQTLTIPMLEVDAHNVVPAWLASTKQEVGARTLRPKIHRLLPTYLEEFPPLTPQKFPWAMDKQPIDWVAELQQLTFDQTVPPVSWIKPGEKAAQLALEVFIAERLEAYNDTRNDPTLAGQSELSPYLHYGQLAPQRVALTVDQAKASPETKDRFIEELIVRRELSDNFCLYNPDYDRVEGFPLWAQKSLAAHTNDPREFLYSLVELDNATTHDELWNAAQLEMKIRGKLHGYMRMYWAKKILEWTISPQQALEFATYLNDRYLLDGRDPNGYTGLAWSIGGVHDRPWFDRPIFGLIRYMNYSGSSKKFSIKKYVQYVEQLKSTDS